MTDNTKPNFFYGYIIVLAGFIIMMIAWGAFYTFGIFFKPLLTEFGWTRTIISGAFSLCSVLLGILAIVIGRLNDRFGPRLVVTVCGFLLGLGYLLMSQVSTIWQLYLFYGVIIGVGMGGTFVPLASTIARWFVRRRGTMTGIASAGIAAGIMIMPPVANWLISSYDWRTAYIIIGITVSVFIIGLAQFLKRDPGQKGEVPYGESELKAESLNMPTGGFSFREALYTRPLWLLLAAYLFYGFWLNSIMVHIVPHATELGISATSAANILAIIGGVSFVGRIIMGGASDRMGNRLVFTISFVVVSIALFWLQLAREAWMLYLFAAIIAFGYSGCAALISPIVAELFGLGSHGVLLGITNFAYASGGAVGPIVVGRIFDITGSYQSAFLVSAVVSVIGLIITLFLRPTQGQGLTRDI